MKLALHPFESAGLGLSPFKCVDCFDSVGGSCAFCGTGIRYRYVIESNDGKEFHVGCECVKKVNKHHRVDGFDHVRREFIHKRKRVGVQERINAAQFAWQQERERRLQQFFEENSQLFWQIKFYTGKNKFIIERAKDLQHYGSLSAKTVDIINRILLSEIRIEELKSTAKFIGEKGERIRNASIEVISSIFLGHGEFGPSYLIKLETQSGDQLHWNTNHAVTVGKYDHVDFSVKSHIVVDDLKITRVNRVKFQNKD